MNKTFILDTNVLLLDPLAINKFGSNNKVFIPLTVIEELDRFKKDQNENGRNARYFSRLIDGFRGAGSLFKGIKLENGGTLQVSITAEYKGSAHSGLKLDLNDNLILGSALTLKEAGENVTLITKDINLRLKSDAVNLHAEDYETTDVTVDELYSGQRVVQFDLEKVELFEKERFLKIEPGDVSNIYPNEYLVLVDKNNPFKKALGRFHAKKGGIVPLIKPKEGVWGIHPKNIEQQFALDALLNNEINLVSLVGKAGTGKTLLAIAAGLECAITKQNYSRVLVSRPIVPMGRDLGFLPGVATELARRTGLLDKYNASINKGAAGVPLKGPQWDVALAPDVAHSPEAIWDAVCRAASAELTDGRESHGIEWWKEHGLATKPFPRLKWYLYPTLVEKGLRFELPYQERLLRIGTELGRRLHEHDMHWWDHQLPEYQALPKCKDFGTPWVAALEKAGGKPQDYPFWLLTARSMQYAWGANVGMQLIKEVADNIKGHRGVIINTQAAARLGIRDGEQVEIATPQRKVRGRAVLRQGIRPDTLLLIGQFDHWVTPFTKDFGVPSMNALTSMSLDLTDATGSGADIVRVSVVPAKELAR